MVGFICKKIMDSPTPVFSALFGFELSVLAVVAVGVSLGVCGLMVGLHRKWGWGGDSHLEEKPQRFHAHSVSRLGGVGIFVGFFATLLLVGYEDLALTGPVLICALPVFLVGVGEDITGRVRSNWRLGIAAGAALVGALWLGAVLRLPFGESWGAAHTVLSVVFTAFCVAGVTQSFNIIDGFNGLASGVGMIVLVALGWLALSFGDMTLCAVCWGMAASVFGFFLWNYPGGRLFLGDGGAYLLGFVIALVSVLLVARHPGVSWFLPLMLIIYPVTETLFSSYRKIIMRGTGAMRADGLHFHMLVHKRLNRWGWGSHRYAAWRNSLTSTFFWVATTVTVFLGLAFWDNSFALVCLSIGIAVAYVWFYFRIVRFRVPRWMVLAERNQSDQMEMKFVRTISKLNGHPVNGHPVDGKIMPDRERNRADSVNRGKQTEWWGEKTRKD